MLFGDILSYFVTKFRKCHFGAISRLSRLKRLSSASSERKAKSTHCSTRKNVSDFFSYAKHFRLVANTGNYTGGQLSSRQMEGG